MPTSPLKDGNQTRVFASTQASAGSETSQVLALQSDTVLVTLWADSVVGTLDVAVYTLDGKDTGHRVLVAAFPQLTAATAADGLLLRRAAITMDLIQIVATFSAACAYEVHARGIQTGSTDARIIGSSSIKTTKVPVTTSAGAVLPVALTDRNDVVFKNWSTSGNVYLASSLAGATTASGFPLAPKDALGMTITAGTTVYAVSDSGTVDLRVMEAGG